MKQPSEKCNVTCDVMQQLSKENTYIYIYSKLSFVPLIKILIHFTNEEKNCLRRHHIIGH